MWVGVTGGGEFGVRKEFCGLDIGEREPRSESKQGGQRQRQRQWK